MKMITTKEAKRIMKESMFIAAPKPYIVAAYELMPRKKKKLSGKSKQESSIILKNFDLEP